MNYKKKSIRDVSFAGKKVLLRVDFNVPLDKTTHEITNDKRIVAALPTIQYLIDHQAKVILCSHLGRPKGEYKEEFSLAPVAARLSELLHKEVKLAADKEVVGENAKSMAAAMQPGDVILLCGKGHEDYQIIGHEKIHMDEREIVAEILEKRKREK